jgi:hypothetical protein
MSTRRRLADTDEYLPPLEPMRFEAGFVAVDEFIHLFKPNSESAVQSRLFYPPNSSVSIQRNDAIV